jgi:3-phenylpropionate/cinnamic acid dioxygenase small subunit
MSVDTLPRGHELTEACTRFLYAEAHLLDRRDFDAWLSLLTSDVIYEVPVRSVQIGGIDEYSDRAFYFKEDYASLEARVLRFHTDHAWAEDPPSKTRRLISGVFVVESTGDDVIVRSTFMLLRYRMSESTPDILSGERLDRLRFEAGRFMLASRSAYLDASVLGTHNLSIFI